MFKITNGKGFHITFASGYTISVQFGSGNYGDNYNLPYSSETPPSIRAEIAIWKKGDGLLRINPSGDTVIGYLTADEVAKYIADCVAGTVTIYPDSWEN